MSIHIHELFGYAPGDSSPAAIAARSKHFCPFIGETCVKTLNDKTVSGVCTLNTPSRGPVICCPIRLYGGDYQVLKDIADICFGPDCQLIPVSQLNEIEGKKVVVFGKKWGKELRIPKRVGNEASADGESPIQRGSFYVDWVMALVANDGTVSEFSAIEVQTIDTTNNYRGEREALMKGEAFTGKSTVNLNWENVNKRIIPQLIYKGNVLAREGLCKHGLWFVSPDPVYKRIMNRLGSALQPYPPSPGTISFLSYNLDDPVPQGKCRAISIVNRFTTSIHHLAQAFISTLDLPPAKSYEMEINKQLKLVAASSLGRRKP